MNESEKNDVPDLSVVIETARAEMRKAAEEFFCMSEDDIPAEIYAAFCAGYADGKTRSMTDCRKIIEDSSNLYGEGSGR
jgi:hypothetical protein